MFIRPNGILSSLLATTRLLNEHHGEDADHVDPLIVLSAYLFMLEGFLASPSPSSPDPQRRVADALVKFEIALVARFM